MVLVLLTGPRVTAGSESVSRPERVRPRDPCIYAIGDSRAAPCFWGSRAGRRLRAVEVVGLMIAAMSGLARAPSIADEASAMAFVVDFAALLLAGRATATIVATLGVVLRGLAGLHAVEWSRTLPSLPRRPGGRFRPAGWAERGPFRVAVARRADRDCRRRLLPRSSTRRTSASFPLFLGGPSTGMAAARCARHS